MEQAAANEQARHARSFAPLLFVEAALLAGALAAVTLASGWETWDLSRLGAIAVLAIVGELMSVWSSGRRVRVSGTFIALMLAAVLLGPGPAALLGFLSISVGWLGRREPAAAFCANLVNYTWFPLASALFFHGAIAWIQTGPGEAYYYFLIVPTCVVGLIVNVAGVAADQRYRNGVPVSRTICTGLVPILPAELFSALLVTAAVYLVVKTGTVGIVVLAVILAIFQYLVGELLKSQQRAEELRRKATTDELTGLANREHFNAALEERVASALVGGGPFAVMLIDLDRFKEINDTLGHHYGDVLLRDLGPRLAQAVGEDGLVARLGGDEFAVLPATRTEKPDRLASIASELIDCIREPIVVDELTLDVGASIGISRFPHDGDDVHDLLRRADVAMYAAKEDHASFRLYETRLDRYSVRRLTVLSDFRRGLESDEFVLHFQPIVDVDDGRIRGAEGLVRWNHRELGLLSPADFVPIAEQSGLIGPLTRYVLERAIFECTDWRANGHDLAVAVNLSVRDLLDRDLPAQVSSVLSAYNLPPQRLHLEITESMIMSDPERSLATVRRLRELGVKISVDDFGTGYSSLSNLKQLPVNELKIDRSFISSLLHDDSDLIIVRSTISLGHDLGLNVIAEGVEDEMTLKRLAMLGCDLAQGYHLGRPIPSDAFLASLLHSETAIAQAASA
jgi:diguanylate cyclase (GGDEF)-like protein